MTTQHPGPSVPARTPIARALCLGGSLLLVAMVLGGCIIAGIAAVAGKAIEDSTPNIVSAEYDGLTGKTVAVVVSADRSAQAEFPTLVFELTRRINERLAKQGQIAGYVSAADMALFVANNPQWPAMTRTDLAEALGGVERLVLVELYEYRLRDPGNRYLWNGVASGITAVVEADSTLPEEYAFQQSFRVGFPDDSGRGPNDFGAGVVATALLQRTADRVAWLFAEHDEPRDIEY